MRSTINQNVLRLLPDRRIMINHVVSGLILLCLAVSASATEWKDDFRGVGVTLPDGSTKLYPDPQQWAFTFKPGIKWPTSFGDGVNWLEANAECQAYLTPFTEPRDGTLSPAARYDPFTIQPDGLHIRAAKLTNQQIDAYHLRPGRIFGSGLLLSRHAFQYGTIRMVARLPNALGTWPALWLLPDDSHWPPELDIVEAMPWRTHARQIHAGLIAPPSEQANAGGWFDIGADPTDGFHEYKATWTRETISIFFDGKLILSRPTPPSFRQRMYVIVNLAVGGKWPYNELGVPPVDGVDNSRLIAGSRMIESDYPAEMTLRSVVIDPE